MTSTFMAMVLLRAPVALTAASVTDAVSGVPAAAKAKVLKVDDSGTQAAIALDDQRFAVSVMPERLTRDDFARELADGPRPDLEAALDTHTAHMMVLCRLPQAEMGQAVMAATGVHLLAAHLGALADPLAVLWVSSARGADWDGFMDMASALPQVYENAPAFPLPFWTAVQLTQTGDLYGAQTKGLAPLTGYELDLRPAPMSASDVAVRVRAAVQYLMTSGPVLKDGDTLGASETERFKVQMTNVGAVMQLRLETSTASTA